MAPAGEKNRGRAEQECKQALAAVKAERQNGGQSHQRHEAVEPNACQAKANQHRRSGKQDDEDNEQDTEAAFAVELLPLSPAAFPALEVAHHFPLSSPASADSLGRPRRRRAAVRRDDPLLTWAAGRESSASRQRRRHGRSASAGSPATPDAAGRRWPSP